MDMATKVRQHQWVKHVVVPVDVLENPITGKPQILTDNDKLDSAIANAVHGCAACSAPLDSQSVQTACEGYDEDLLSP